MATSNGNGNRVRRVATAGSGDEVRRVTAISDEMLQMATAMVALYHSGCQQRWSASNSNVEWRRQWSASSGDGWQRR